MIKSLIAVFHDQALYLRILGGRYWDRTSDLFRVKEARSRCANRPEKLVER